MISLKCKNCSGEMSIDTRGELVCPYCRSKSYMSDIELEDYKNYRSNMLNFLRATADEEADKLDEYAPWEYHDNVQFKTNDGKTISINYYFYSEEDNVQCYVAKDTVIYVFGDSKKINAMQEGIASLSYPSAALKNLSKYFPTIKAKYSLDDGKLLIVIAKPENAYPIFAYGAMYPEHAAWIVSRLENICCVFEYSEINHNGLSINSIFINTRTHEAFLYGGWWNWTRKSRLSAGNDLKQIRNIAGQILGAHRDEAPKLFIDFINGMPSVDAYSDFELWDTVIEKGFGGHKFAKYRKG